jgi:hypothetical protein
MKFWIVLLAVFVALPNDLAWAQSQPAGTVLEPRSKTDYEKHLAELNAKYGADKSQSALKDAVLKASGTPDKTMPGATGGNRVALPADLIPGQKLRIELLPHGEREFLFQDEVYDSESLAEALAGVKRGYVIDQVILLNSPDRPIQIDHLLELARIGRDLELLTAYQQGDELKLISAK